MFGERWHAATWRRGKQIATGMWAYNWAKDRFIIILKSGRTHYAHGEKPEWGSWKLLAADAAERGEG